MMHKALRKFLEEALAENDRLLELGVFDRAGHRERALAIQRAALRQMRRPQESSADA
jgi:hypothetical protein